MSAPQEGCITTSDDVSEVKPAIQPSINNIFKQISKELDEKHDRYERIVKLSRDITIESKRIIFLLHNKDIDSEPRRTDLLSEANKRLNALVEKQFRAIAGELHNLDGYQYLRAYTAGMQEFIEALLFYEYIKNDRITNWSIANEKFNYSSLAGEKANQCSLLFPQLEFMLGLADFTGELMRKCINSLGTGMIDDCFKTCSFVRYIFTGFLGVNMTGCRELSRKLYTLRQSLNKMELVCYNIRVRGSEVPKHMLALVATPHTDDILVEDEGYFN